MNRGLHNRLGPVRKATAALLRIRRMGERWRGAGRDAAAPPAVMANSFPKSGTHLLEQVLDSLPGVRNFGVFLSSMTSSWAFRERTKESTLRVIDSVLSGELLRAHLFYDEAYEAAMRRKGIAHYFIFRDPRDVVVSEAYYLKDMNRWHRLHRLMKTLDAGAAITMAITGASRDTGLYYPNISDRFARYAGWLDSPHTYAVRFEDLRSERLAECVSAMVQVFETLHPDRIAKGRVVRNAMAHINPERSHTFRQGGSSAWRREFNAEHKTLFKKVAGQLLIDLGYENDLHW